MHAEKQLESSAKSNPLRELVGSLRDLEARTPWYTERVESSTSPHL